MIRATVVGSYPRIGDSHEEQKLRRAIARLDKGEITEQDLRDVEHEVVREVLREQSGAGIDLITDGQITWYDSQSHVARRLAGIEIDGLVRYFDTNTYYRQPIVKGAVQWNGPILSDEWRFAQEHSSVPVKAVVTGPVTLAALARGAHAGTVRTLALELARALAHEVESLAQAGVGHIQIDEPILARSPEHLAVAKQTTELLAGAKGRAQLSLFVYFGGVNGIYRDLLQFPIDVLGLDLVQGAGTWERIEKEGSAKPLILGVVDARNTRVEDPVMIASRVRALADVLDLDACYLSPSNGLEFLPRAKAREKLSVLAKTAKLVGGAS